MSTSGDPAAGSAGFSLNELAERFGLALRGDGDCRITGVCSLSPGMAGRLGFLADPKRRADLARTLASAMILAPRDAGGFAGPALLAADPAVAFARVAALFDRSREMSPGIHASAVVAADAVIGKDSWIGPHVVIESGVCIGSGCFIGPGCVIREAASLGDGGRLEAQVYVGRGCSIGARAHLHPGSVIGSRGFGLARSKSGWIEVPQLGSVRIGDDVEVGANTNIDRGAIDDTVIEDGVKLDNQIQIGHNCRIGAHTAVAACAGISGSTVIGKRCLIGGAAGIGGHLRIADDVVILGRTMVTKSLPAPGIYGSGLPVMPAREWRRLVARVRRLHHLEQRFGEIEKSLGLRSEHSLGEASEPDDY